MPEHAAAPDTGDAAGIHHRTTVGRHPPHRPARHLRPGRPHRDPAPRHGHVPPVPAGGHPLAARLSRRRPAHPHRVPAGHGARTAGGRPDERPLGTPPAAAHRPRRLPRRHRPVRGGAERRDPGRLPARARTRGRGGDRHRTGRRTRPLRRRGHGPLLLHPDADLRGSPRSWPRSSAGRSCGSRTGGGVFVVLTVVGAALAVLVWLRLPETLPPAGRHGGGVGQALRAMRGLLADLPFTGYMLAGGFAFAALFAYISASPFVIQEIYGASPQTFSLLFGLNSVRPGDRRPDQRQGAGRPGQPGQGARHRPGGDRARGHRPAADGLRRPRRGRPRPDRRRPLRP